jgi:hypothetical protein
MVSVRFGTCSPYDTSSVPAPTTCVRGSKVPTRFARVCVQPCCCSVRVSSTRIERLICNVSTCPKTSVPCAPMFPDLFPNHEDGPPHDPSCLVFVRRAFGSRPRLALPSYPECWGNDSPPL